MQSPDDHVCPDAYIGRDFLKNPFISNFRAVVLMRLVNYTNHSVTKNTHDKGSFSLAVHAEFVPLIMPG